MKICSKCGSQNNDEAMFCEQCGAALSANHDNQYLLMPASMLQILRQHGGSALFLAVIICMTLQVVAQMFANIRSSSVFAELESYYTFYDLSQTNEIMHTISIVYLIGLIPVILILIGLYMIYVNCRKQDKTSLINTTGFSLVRSVMIFRLVYSILAPIVIYVAVIFMARKGASYMSQASSSFVNTSMKLESFSNSGVSDSMSSQSAAPAFVVFYFGLLIIVFILEIIYYIKAIGSLKCAQEIIGYGSTKKNISAFVGVLQIIGGVLLIFLCVILSMFLVVNNDGTIIPVLAFWLFSNLFAIFLSGVTSLLFGILIMSVRKEFGAVLFMQNQQNFMR